MAKRKKKIGKNDITETTLYRAMMKRKYQTSGDVDPWGIAASVKGGYSAPSGIAYDATGAVDEAMTATNIGNLESAAAGAGGGAPTGAISAAGASGEFAGGSIEQASGPGKYGSRSAGQIAGSTLSSVGKGAALGATIGSVVPVVGTAAGAIIGAGLGLGSSIISNIGQSNEGAKEFAAGHLQGGKNVLAQQNQEFEKEQAQNLQKRNLGTADQQDVYNFNAFNEVSTSPFPGTSMPSLMGEEGKYENSGKIRTLLNHRSEMEKSNTDLRSKLSEFRKSLKTSGGMGMDIRRGATGNPYSAGIGGGANISSGNVGIGFGGGISPQYGPQGFAGLGYGGGLSATYNPNPNVQLSAGIGTGGMINKQGESTPQLSPGIGIRANFKRGGMVKKGCYETGGSIEDQYTDALNNIAQGYVPPAARQNKNQFAQQIGPNREITEPGVYQVNGDPHEEGGTNETVPTINGPETAEFDDKEFLETTVTTGGMETFAFNNHEGDKDADQFAAIQKELDKVQKELELIGEMNPEYVDEIKKALS